MKTSRILINTPSSHGGIGDLYNFSLSPSLTLGCGSWGGNSVSENVGPKHLLNKKIVAKRAENMLWHKLPGSIYFRRGCIPEALKEIAGRKRALMVTDDFLFRNGCADDLIDDAEEAGYGSGRLLAGAGRSEPDHGAQMRRSGQRLSARRDRGVRRRLADGRGQDCLGHVRASRRWISRIWPCASWTFASAFTSSPRWASRPS